MRYVDLLPPFMRDIVWVRVYVNRDEKRNCMNREEIQESVEIYGNRTVRRVLPGYNFLIVWLEA